MGRQEVDSKEEDTRAGPLPKARERLATVVSLKLGEPLCLNFLALVSLL